MSTFTGYLILLLFVAYLAFLISSVMKKYNEEINEEAMRECYTQVLTEDDIENIDEYLRLTSNISELSVENLELIKEKIDKMIPMLDRINDIRERDMREQVVLEYEEF